MKHTETKSDWYEHNVIDPLIYQTALELSAASGEQVRELMRQHGYTEAEIKDVFKKAFEWLHKDEI